MLPRIRIDTDLLCLYAVCQVEQVNLCITTTVPVVHGKSILHSQLRVVFWVLMYGIVLQQKKKTACGSNFDRLEVSDNVKRSRLFKNVDWSRQGNKN